MRILLVIVFIGLAQGALCQKDTLEERKFKQIKQIIVPDTKQKSIKPCSDYISCFKYCFDSLIQSKTKLTDTVDFKKLSIKQIKECNLHLKKYFKTKNDKTPFNGIAIKHTPGGHFNDIISYFRINEGVIITGRTVIYYRRGHIRQDYQIITESHIKHGTYTRYYYNGFPKLKVKYQYGHEIDTTEAYNESGLVTYKYDHNNNKMILNPVDTIFFKNYFSLNILSSYITELRVSYERFVFKRQSLKIEGAYQWATTDETEKGIWSLVNQTRGMLIIGTNITNAKYISLAYNYYFDSNRNRKTLLYVTAEPYFLYKYYENKYYREDFEYSSGNFFYIKYLQSEQKKIWGIKFLLGLKHLFFKTSNRTNLIYDIYTGLGIRYIDDLITRYSEYNDLFHKEIIYPEPQKVYKYMWKPTFNLGIKIGIAWRRK